MTTTRLRRDVAVVLAAAVALTATVLAVPAQAAVGEVRAGLNIDPVPGNVGRCTVRVRGHVVTSQAEAQGLIAQGHRIVVRLWGYDWGRDDKLLFGPRTATTAAAARGLDFELGVTLASSQLDEDPAPLAGSSSDEVYAGVRLLNSAGQTIRSTTTFKIGAQFGNGCDGSQTLL